MNFLDSIVLIEILPYLLGIFGLLVLWQYYQIQVMKGHIQAIDIFDRSNNRMYVFVVADDPSTCAVCRSAHGTVFPPSQVIKKHFSPVTGTCKNPAGCVGFLVGLYGAWPEARQVVERLRVSPKRQPIRLDQDELMEMVLGPWEQSISANTDRLGIYLLEAVLGDSSNPQPAVNKYSYVLEHAKEIRHLPLIVPVCLRLVDLLAAQGRTTEALQFIYELEKSASGTSSSPSAPTQQQLTLLRLKKSQLKNIGSVAGPAAIA